MCLLLLYVIAAIVAQTSEQTNVFFVLDDKITAQGIFQIVNTVVSVYNVNVSRNEWVSDNGAQ